MADFDSIQLQTNLSDSDSDRSNDDDTNTPQLDYNFSLFPPHSPTAKGEATSSKDPERSPKKFVYADKGQNLTFKDVANQYISSCIANAGSSSKQSKVSRYGLSKIFNTTKSKGGISPPILHRFGSRLLAMRTPWKLRTNEMNGRNNSLEISSFLRVLERKSHEYLLEVDMKEDCDLDSSQSDRSGVTYGLDEFFNTVYSKANYILPQAEGKWKYDMAKSSDGMNSVNIPVTIGGNVYHLKDFGLPPGTNFHQKFAIWDINLDSPNLSDEHGGLFNNQILLYKMHPMGFPCLNYILSIANSILFWLKLNEHSHFAVINYASLNYTSLLIMACAALASNSEMSLSEVEHSILTSLDWRGKCRSSEPITKDSSKGAKKCMSMDSLKDSLNQCSGRSSKDEEIYSKKGSEKCLNFFPDLEKEEEKRLAIPKTYHPKIAQECDGLYPISLWPPSHRRYLGYFKTIVTTPHEKLKGMQVKPFRIEKIFFKDFFQVKSQYSSAPGARRFTKTFLDSVLRTSDDFFSIEIYELDFYHKMVRSGEADPTLKPNLYHSQAVPCSSGRYKPLLFPEAECGAPFEPREANGFSPGVRLRCCNNDYNVIGTENYEAKYSDECIPMAIDFLHDREGNDRNLVIAGDVVICLIGHNKRSARQIIATYSFNTSFHGNDGNCVLELEPYDFDMWSQHNWMLHGYGLRDCMEEFGLRSKNSQGSLINPKGKATIVLQLLDNNVFEQPSKALKFDASSTGWTKSISKLKTRILSTSVVSTLASFTPTGSSNIYLPPYISYQVSTPDRLPSLSIPFPSIADYLVSHIVSVGEQSVVFLSDATHVAPEKCLVALKIFQADYVESLKFVKTYFKDITRTDTMDDTIIDTVKYKSKEALEDDESKAPSVVAAESEHETLEPPKTSLRDFVKKVSEAEKEREIMDKFDPDMRKKLERLEKLEKELLEKERLEKERAAKLEQLEKEKKEKEEKLEQLERERKEALEKATVSRLLVTKVSSPDAVPTVVSTIQVPVGDSKDVITITHTEGPNVTASVAEAKAAAMAADAKATDAKAVEAKAAEAKAAEAKAVEPKAKAPPAPEVKVTPPEATEQPSAPKSKATMKKGKGKKMMAPPKKLLPAPKPANAPKAKSPFGFKLHWKPISDKKLENSIFNKMETEDRKGIIDTHIVKRLFSRVKEDGSQKDESAAKEVKEKKEPAVTVFDHRRAQNLSILLRADYPLDILVEMLDKLRVTGIPHIYKPESEGDKKLPTVLDVDLISKLKQSCPTTEETEALLAIEKDTAKLEKLRDIEKKMIPLAKVKFMTQKLRVCEFTAAFKNRIDEGMNQLNVHLTACNDVLTSTQLPIFVSAVLEWGNFVNHGSFEFVTRGFALSSAARLADFKSLDQSLSSLHYLLVNLCVKFPALSLETMAQRLVSVFDAQRTSTNSINEIIGEVSAELNFCTNFQKQVQAAEPGVYDPEFVERLSLIMADAEKTLGNLKDHKTHVHNQIVRVWDYLGEEWKSQDPLETIFETLWHLLKTVENSFEDIAKKPDKYLIALQCPHEQSKLRNIFVSKGKKSKAKT